MVQQLSLLGLLLRVFYFLPDKIVIQKTSHAPVKPGRDYAHDHGAA